MAPQFKLYYFNIRGRGEIDRLVLAAAGQPFEDVRFEDADWPKYQHKSPSKKCPFLEEIDGSDVFTLTQSLAIARYLAKKFDLAGKSDREIAEMDMYGDQIMDLQEELIKTRMETDEARKLEITKKFNEETLPRNMDMFERKLSQSKSGYLAPSGLTWPDLHLMNVVEWFDEPQQVIFSNYKLVREHCERVRALPNVANWIAKRPTTEI